MSKVYRVYSYGGDYEDYREVQVGTYSTEEEAKAITILLNETLINCDLDYDKEKDVMTYYSDSCKRRINRGCFSCSAHGLPGLVEGYGYEGESFNEIPKELVERNLTTIHNIGAFKKLHDEGIPVREIDELINKIKDSKENNT